MQLQRLDRDEFVHRFEALMQRVAANSASCSEEEITAYLTAAKAEGTAQATGDGCPGATSSRS